MTGASRGIGRAVALRLGTRGSLVGLHYHRGQSQVHSVAESLEAGGASSFAVKANLEKPEEAERLAAEVAQRVDRLDALVLNAGTYPRKRFDELTADDFESTYRLHVISPAVLAQKLIPLLRRSDHPRIIFVSSILAFTGSDHGAAYAAAKAGVLGLARSLARELAPQITVNAVAPGTIDTAILAEDSAERRAERIRSIPLRRLGTPEDVAEVVAFLASPSASYLTGTTVHVNGGLRSD